VTPEEVATWAAGTLATWLTGYTDVLEDGYQRKITIEGYGDEGEPDLYRIKVLDRMEESEKLYLIGITVKEVTDGPTGELEV
jgi:hypothetical protein